MRNCRNLELHALHQDVNIVSRRWLYANTSLRIINVEL